MESAAARDDLVKRANATLKQYPNFDSLPEVKGGDFEVVPAAEAGGYHAAVYKLSDGYDVVGRSKKGAIVGKKRAA